MSRRQLYPRPRDSFWHPSDLQPHLSHQRQQCNAASSASFSHDAWPRTCAKGGGTSAMSATSSIASQSARRQRHTLAPAKSSLSPFSQHSSWVDFRARCCDEGLRKISRRPPSSDSWLRRDTSRTTWPERADSRSGTSLEMQAWGDHRDAPMFHRGAGRHRGCDGGVLDRGAGSCGDGDAAACGTTEGLQRTPNGDRAIAMPLGVDDGFRVAEANR